MRPRSLSDPATGPLDDTTLAVDRDAAARGAADRDDTTDGGAMPDTVGPGDGSDDEPPDDREVRDTPAGGLSWTRVAILGVALTFLGFALGMFATRDRPPGGDSVDVGFLHDMLAHHEQALGLSALTIAYGEDPTVRTFAREVLSAQGYEQGLMSQKLADWGYSRADRPDTAMGWMGMEMPHEDMPGLLSDEQMEAARNARGAELDALFLDLMAEHHRGGLHMAAYAAEHADDEGIRDMATRMEHAQAGEINEYRHTAQEMGLEIEIPGADVPPPDLPEPED